MDELGGTFGGFGFFFLWVIDDRRRTLPRSQPGSGPGQAM